MTFRSVSRISRTLAAACLVLLIASAFRKSELPRAAAILPELLRQPVQKLTKGSHFEFDYGGRKYMIEPAAQYELWGLIVSHNDISEFIDIYHDKSSVDIKDLCVIWGENIEDDTFRRLEYWSEPFTCYYRTRDRAAAAAFARDQLSNNHLLSESPEVRRRIAQAHIGDQIHLKGLLVNYYPRGRSEQVRRSSISRTDTGNGACEVVLVDEFNILRAGNPGWQRIYYWSVRGLIAALVLAMVGFVGSAYSR